MKKRDLTGQTFGKLYVLGEAEPYVSPKGYRKTMWKCRCECGNECVAMSSHLLSGHTLSCGCQQTVHLHPRKAADLTGQKFGMLTVMHRMPNRLVGKNSRVVWHCRCECGRETDVLALLLSEGLVKSCGCLSVSHAERIMADYLSKNVVEFVSQYQPDGLQGVGGGRLKFDFAVFLYNELRFLIELDGIQHYEPVAYFGGVSKYEQIRANDSLKSLWANEHHAKLIRIDVSGCCLDSDFVDLYRNVLSSYLILD